MKIKLGTLLISLSNLVFLTFVTASGYTSIETNHVLRINGPIFLRTSEEFAPDKMQYLAADINGNAYNIEGNLVSVTFTGIENFHGEFLPPKTIFLESEHQFVGHATLPVNAGRITVRIGENEKSYRMRDHDAIIKDTFIVNNSIYEISVIFSRELRKDVLFKSDPNKARAITHFITIDEIKWISYTPQYSCLKKLGKFEEKEQIARQTEAIRQLITQQPEKEIREERRNRLKGQMN